MTGSVLFLIISYVYLSVGPNVGTFLPNVLRSGIIASLTQISPLTLFIALMSVDGRM